MITADRKVDPRVRRTRALLEQAFIELLAEKTFESISVKDIAERADVNRATFYDHFQDKYNLLDQVTGDLFRRSVQLRMETPDHKLTDIRHLVARKTATVIRPPQNLTSLREEFRIFLAATFEAFDSMRTHQAHHRFHPEPAAVVYPRIRQEINALLLKDFRALLNAEGEAEAHQLASVLTWVIYGAAFDWIRSAKTTTADEVSAQMVALLSREFLILEPRPATKL